MFVNCRWMPALSAVLVVTVVASIRPAQAQSCSPPSREQIQSATEYVAKRYRIASERSISLTESVQANSACFWKLQYQVADTRREMTLYLSPDRRFLTPLLYDLEVDPTAEIAEQQRKISELLSAGDPPARGPRNAVITVVEFADFQCPFCARMNSILKETIDAEKPGAMRVIFHNFPLTMHPWAKLGAEIAECAGFQNQGLFWQAHDFIYEHQKSLTVDNIDEIVSKYLAQQPVFNKDSYASCMSKELSLGVVTKDLELGKRFGVRGTPTIFVNGTRIQGVRDSAQLKAAIESAISGVPAPASSARAAEATICALTAKFAPSHGGPYNAIPE